METGLAVKEEAGAVAVYDFEQDAGGGFENQTNADVMIPYLKAMQGLSKEVKASKDGRVRAGMLLNNVSGEAVPGDKGVLVVPVTTDHCFVEFKPRSAGGGFVARHELDSPFVAQLKAQHEAAKRPFGKLNTEYDNAGKGIGNEIQEVFYVYAVQCTEDGQPIGPVVIPMKSTDIKYYRKWNTGPRSFRLPRSKPAPDGSTSFVPPLYAHFVRVTLVETPYPAGSAFNYVLVPAKGTIAQSLTFTPGQAPSAAYVAGAELHKLIQAGVAKINMDAEEPAGDSTTTGKNPF